MADPDGEHAVTDGTRLRVLRFLQIVKEDWLRGLMAQSPGVFDLTPVRAVRGLWSTLRLRLAA